ncbi:MAG TPA: hypothetical protein VF865_09060 [Acidobacteriaceae bacterium]
MSRKADLLSFLDKRVFHPILNAKENRYDTRQREDLQDLKRRTEAEKARFHGYDSAERVVAMYKDDLSSETAKPVNARLKDLGLPRLADVKDEFLRRAGEGS